MKVGDIMNRAPLSVRTDETFETAFQKLIANRVSNLPVVDPNGVFQGNFDLKDVWSLLLPKAAKLDRKSIEDLSFMPGSIEKFQEMLAGAAQEKTTKFVSPSDAPPLYPESSALQAVLMFYEYGHRLAVVERGTRKLVGTVSGWDLLVRLQR